MSQSSPVAETEGSFSNSEEKMFVNVRLDVDEPRRIMARIVKETRRTANDVFWQLGEYGTGFPNLMPGAATVKTEDEKNQKVMFLLKGVKKKKGQPKVKEEEVMSENCFHYAFSLSSPSLKRSAQHY